MQLLWTLQIIESGHPSRDVIARGGMTIGRHSDSGLLLTDPFVSSRHAEIVEDAGGLAIMDLGSNNGTLVGDSVLLRKGDRQVLRNGMAISLGGARIVVREAGDGSETQSEPAVDAEMTIVASSPDEPPTVLPSGAPPSKPAPVKKLEPTPPPASKPAAAPAATPAPAAKLAPTPAPTPAPKPEPEAPVVPKPTPVAASAPDPAESILGGTVFANKDQGLAGIQTKLDHMGARLLLLNEADLRVIELRSQKITIGRSSSADCTLANKGVSSKHAVIEFRSSGNLFFLKDLGSANGTHVNGIPLDANMPFELGPDSYMRFGTVDALFLQSMDAGFHAIPPERHQNAAKLLVARGKLTSSVVKQAREDAVTQGVALGEILLLGQHVEPREWARSVKDAAVASTLQHLSSVNPKRIAMWVLVGLALGVAALLCFPSGRDLFGLGG